MICPGDTRIGVGLGYPAPVKVGPCPNSGQRLMMIAKAAMKIIWRMVHPSVDLNEPTGRKRDRSTDRILPLCSVPGDGQALCLILAVSPDLRCDLLIAGMAVHDLTMHRRAA